jgi:hypothetical protein
MPCDHSTFELPDGRRCARLDWSGFVSAEEADAALALSESGGPLYGLPVLSVALKMTGMSPEARAIFSSPRRNALSQKLALVTADPVIRVTANFVFRIQRNKSQRHFRSEAEAVAWLTEKDR